MPAQAYLVSALGRVVREFGVSVLVVRIQTPLPMRLASTAKVGAAMPMVCKAGVVGASRVWRASAGMMPAQAYLVSALGRVVREFGVSVLVVRIQTPLPMRLASTAKVGA